MRNFWPAFFCFVLALLLFLWGFNPDAIDAALLFLGVWFTMLLYVLLVAVGGALLLGAWIVYARIQRNRSLPVDGAYPLQRFRLRNGRTAIINPTHMIGPAAIIDRRTGEYTEVEHPAGWDVVRDVRRDIERSNTVRAMFPGDAARRDRFGAQSAMPRLNASTFRQLESKAPTPPRIIGEQAPPIKPPASPVSVGDALRTNSRTALAVGQVPLTGEIVRWELDRHPHARFHGATQGSGKTNAARTVLLGMALMGAHVVVLDRRRMKDFRDFDGKAELIDTSNPQAFVEAMQRLEAIYRERDRLLGAHGAANIDELPQRLVRYAVMVTEFGTLCAVADGEGLLRDAMRPLANIMREAGAAGIHLLFEDQIVEKGHWPRGVAANASGVFTGHLPLNMGAAGGYHHAHQLGQYEFHHDGQVFRTWDTRPVMRKLLASAPAYDARLAVLDGVASVGGDGERSAPPSHSGEPVNTSTMNDPDERWEEVVFAWFLANPQALTGPARGISDLARAMAEAEGAIKPYENYKGIAHKLYHKFRNDVRINGQPLGVDITEGKLH